MSSSKDKLQKQQEKFQAILSNLLREEDNKYCADCDAKGPRWASWNIGVFLCIRCAGIHRNLGVHISRVKSVNLDQWTAEQISSMQVMGNNKAKTIYECHLPENYRRSQTDSAMEQFIRAKYEARKWYNKEWIPPILTISLDLLEDDKEKRKASDKTSIQLNIKPAQSASTSQKTISKKTEIDSNKHIETKTNEISKDKKEETLLNFDFPDNLEKNHTNITNKTTNDIEDLFSNFNIQPQNQDKKNEADLVTNSNSLGNVSNLNLMSDLLINSTPSTNSSTKIDTHSILALYSSPNIQKTQINQMTQSQSFHQTFDQSIQNKTNNFQKGFSVQQNQPFKGSPKIFNSNQQNSVYQNQFASLLDNFNLPQVNKITNNQSNQNNNNNNNMDLFDSFSSSSVGAGLPNQSLPNIGNTLSSDLWQ